MQLLGGPQNRIERQTLNFAVATDFLRYIPFTGVNISSTIGSYTVTRIAPAAGFLKRIHCYAYAAAGITSWGIHINGAAALEAVSADLPAFTVVEFPFSGAYHFTDNDIICISQDPTTAPAACVVELEWYLDQ